MSADWLPFEMAGASDGHPPRLEFTPDWLAAQMRRGPNKLALLTPEMPPLSFIMLDGLVDAWSMRLLAFGFKRGQRIGLWLESGAVYAALLLACLRVGAVSVPLNLRLTPAEIGWQVERSRCAGVIVSAERVADVRAVVTCRVYGVEELERHAAGGFDLLAQRERLDLRVPAAIVHTSGTSGRPKGAVLTAGNFFYSAWASAERLGVRRDDRWLAALPLYHVGGMSIIFRSALYGTVVDLLPRFEIEEVARRLIETPVTLVSLVPTMLYRLMREYPPPWNPALRLVLLGGAAPSAELVERCIAAGIPLATTYGLTEAASQVATAPPAQVARKPGSVGKPLIGTKIRIVSENGDDQPVGAVGEIVAQGGTVMLGYDDNPQATADTLRDGWLHTGDLGYLDADGDLWVMQRRSDLIISGGENIYPAEVEAALRKHPAVAEAAVIGLEDAEWGQRVGAVVVLHDVMQITAEGLIAYCRRELAGYKVPREIRLVSALPQTASGKIERAALRQLFDDHLLME